MARARPRGLFADSGLQDSGLQDFWLLLRGPSMVPAHGTPPMPKNKQHKGILKRIRISKTGKVRHKTAGHKHLRSGKGGKRLRQMRKDPYMANPEAKRLEKLLFRRLRGRTQPRTAIRKSPSPAERHAAEAEAKK